MGPLSVAATTNPQRPLIHCPRIHPAGGLERASGALRARPRDAEDSMRLPILTATLVGLIAGQGGGLSVALLLDDDPVPAAQSARDEAAPAPPASSSTPAAMSSPTSTSSATPSASNSFPPTAPATWPNSSLATLPSPTSPSSPPARTASSRSPSARLPPPPGDVILSRNGFSLTTQPPYPAVLRRLTPASPWTWSTLGRTERSAVGRWSRRSAPVERCPRSGTIITLHPRR